MRRTPDRTAPVCAVALASRCRRRLRGVRHAVRRRVRGTPRPVGRAPPAGPAGGFRLSRAPVLPTDPTSVRLAARITIAAMAAYLVGIALGFAVSILVLPYRAEQQLVDRVAAGLRLLADLNATLLEPRDAAHLATLDGLNARMRALLASCETTAADVEREHRLHLAGRRDPEPLFRTLRRLRSDAAIIERAGGALGGPDETGVPPEARRRHATIV